MASLDSTPIRELSDTELRKRLVALGYDVPVSVNREFFIKKLESVSSSAISGGGGGGDAAGGSSRSSKRHSMEPSAAVAASGAMASPSTARKRKTIAGTSTSNTHNASRSHHNQIEATPPRTPAYPPTSQVYSPISPVYSPSSGQMTPPSYSPRSPSLSMSTPSTPSPFVSRLNTPSPSSSPNGESNSHSPRFMSYYNMFKSTPAGGGASSGGDSGYGYGYNRSIRMNPVSSVAPPSTRSSERNGYATGGNAGGLIGIESDWCGGHLISKILFVSFILFFLIIGGLYIRKNYMIMDPKGLPGSVGDSGSNAVPPEPAPQVKPAPPPPPAKKDPLPLLKMVYPICGTKGTDPEACIPKEFAKNAKTLFDTLKAELIQRARRKGCHSDVQDFVNLQEAKASLYKLTDMRKADVDDAFQGMLLLVTENPRESLRLSSESFKDSEISSKDVVAGLDMMNTIISAPDVNPDFICGLYSMLTSAVLTVTVVVASAGAGFIGWKLYGMYRQKKKNEEKEMFTYIEKVLEVLQHQYELSEAGEGPSFLAVNHVRDELVPPQDRLKKEALWNKVVHYISNNESRVREEIQHISGEEFKVWRWLPSASPLSSKRFSTTANSHARMSRMHTSPNMGSSLSPPYTPPRTSTPAAGMSPAQSPLLRKSLYPNLSTLNGEDEDDMGEGNSGCDPNSNNKWQGQAFETCEGSPNALPNTPTTCLKIRHMFTAKDASASDRSRIENEILGKCRQAKILHIGMEPNSVEGCVYIRCMSKEDAGRVFQALHGWWFDGHLLSVKFLREERYFARFPEAKACTVPLGS